MTPDSQNQGSSLSKKGIWLESLGAYLFTVIAIVVLAALSSINSLIMEITQALVALLFIGLPWWLLRKKGKRLESLGIKAIPISREIKYALGISLLVFPLFMVGNHLFQTQSQDRELEIGTHWIDRWEHAVHGRPDSLSQEQPFTIWEDQGTWTLLWSAPEEGESIEVSIALTGDSPQSVRSVFVKNGDLLRGRLCAISLSSTASERLEARSKCRGGIRFESREAHQIEIQLASGTNAVENHEIVLGEFSISSGDNPPLRYRRGIKWGLWWILELLLIHIVLVGIPEEVFYRGYLQSRLQQVMPTRWKFFGVSWGPALIVTSLLFALGHYAVGLNPERLLVFFPSLLFGLVRNWTGSIGAAALFHALCNVLQQILIRMYV
jgi:membrane protease YdiL (CAAX protease family)